MERGKIPLKVSTFLCAVLLLLQSSCSSSEPQISTLEIVNFRRQAEESAQRGSRAEKAADSIKAGKDELEEIVLQLSRSANKAESESSICQRKLLGKTR